MNRLINCFSANVTKLFLLSVFTIALMACENTPKVEGLWQHADAPMSKDVISITSDTIKVIKEDGTEIFQTHYKILHDDVIELERCWLIEKAEKYDFTGSDFIPDQFFYEEARMYFDENGYLVIRPFGLPGELVMVTPNYAVLTLKKF